jgi:hypothetical protein
VAHPAFVLAARGPRAGRTTASYRPNRAYVLAEPRLHAQGFGIAQAIRTSAILPREAPELALFGRQ